ncbi:MAG: hypothetical protein IK077_12965 [Thermoguttaceae bacterium]|nr:hypothetical protein [Thermoguttaceae bacterium]
MKKASKQLAIASTVFAVLFASVVIALFCRFSRTTAVPDNYAQTIEPGAPLEAKYLAEGPYKVARFESPAPNGWERYVVFYPEVLEKSGDKFPVVVFVNGAGVRAADYPALFKRAASRGFVAIGNDDRGPLSGASTDATTSFLLAQNDDESSVFYRRIDVDRIGLCGCSQGGAAIFRAITDQPRGNIYRCAATLSPAPSGKQFSDLLKPYDVTIPVLIVSGSEDQNVSWTQLRETYEEIQAPKALVRKKDVDHYGILYAADGYVAAWFAWRLQDDEEAAKAFVGDEPEIAGNPKYRDWKSSLENAGRF